MTNVEKKDQSEDMADVEKKDQSILYVASNVTLPNSTNQRVCSLEGCNQCQHTYTMRQ